MNGYIAIVARTAENYRAEIVGLPDCDPVAAATVAEALAGVQRALRS